MAIVLRMAAAAISTHSPADTARKSLHAESDVLLEEVETLRLNGCRRGATPAAFPNRHRPAERSTTDGGRPQGPALEGADTSASTRFGRECGLARARRIHRRACVGSLVLRAAAGGAPGAPISLPVASIRARSRDETTTLAPSAIQGFRARAAEPVARGGDRRPAILQPEVHTPKSDG